MKRIQKVLFALAAVAALGWFAAEPGLAQVRWETTGGLRIVCAEGRTEVVNAVDLVAQPGAIDVREGTVITLTYDGDISNNFTGDADSIVPEDLVLCEEEPVAASGFCAAVINALLEDNITIDGSNLFIRLDDDDGVPGEDLVVAPEDRITISGVRVDVAAAGPGDLSVTITSSGDPAGHRVTYTDPNVLVARARASLKYTITPSENDLLLCDPKEEFVDPEVAFSIKIEELFSSVFTSQPQEEEAGIEDDAGVDINQGLEIRLRLTGVNAMLTVVAVLDVDAVDFPLLDPFIDGDDTIVSEGEEVDFPIQFDDSDLGAQEDFTVDFHVFLDEGDDLDLDPSVVNLAAQMNPVGNFDEDESEILLFAPNGTNADVFTINECLSFLLYHWVPNTGDGAYDTGLTLSNTGDAPSELKTQSSQTGPCKVYFYSLDGSVPPESPVDVDPLAPGETATMVVSEVLDDPFLGYAIAVCEFQWGHGYWFTNNPQPGTGGGFAQGAAATVLTDRKGRSTESQGQ
jgi:hypothetical protein